MMMFSVCVNDTVQILYKSINYLVEELIMMCFDWSFDFHYGMWLLSVSVLQWNKTDINTSKGQ